LKKIFISYELYEKSEKFSTLLPSKQNLIISQKLLPNNFFFPPKPSLFQDLLFSTSINLRDFPYVQASFGIRASKFITLII